MPPCGVAYVKTLSVVLLACDILQVRAADQAPHGVRHEVDLELRELLSVALTHLPTDAEDELGEFFCIVLDRDLLTVAKGLRILLVVAEDPDRAGVDALILVHEVAVLVGVGVGLVLHQADEGRLEDEPHRLVVLVSLANLRRAEVEPHVGRADGLLDLSHGCGIAADVDDRVVRGRDGAGLRTHSHSRCGHRFSSLCCLRTGR